MKDMIQYLVYFLLFVTIMGICEILDSGGFTYTIDGVKHSIQFSAGIGEKK